MNALFTALLQFAVDFKKTQTLSVDHSSVHDSGDNTPSFFVQFESNSLKKKIIQSGNEHISICTMQFEFTRPQHKQIKKNRLKKKISVGNEILSLSSVARQLSELRIAEALKISLKKSLAREYICAS